MSDAPLILTLRFDAETFAVLQALRERHFPPARNHVPAHLTLFHDLPGSDEAGIAETLRDLCGATPQFPVAFRRVRFLGKGVALDADAPPLAALRSRLAARWAACLTPQDRQPYKPHVTIQNKVEPAEAKQLAERLSATRSPLFGTATGLLLWHYRGGPWELAEEFEFTELSAPPSEREA